MVSLQLRNCAQSEVGMPIMWEMTFMGSGMAYCVARSNWLSLLSTSSISERERPRMNCSRPPMTRGVKALEMMARSCVWRGGSKKMNQFFGAGTREEKVCGSERMRLTLSKSKMPQASNGGGILKMGESERIWAYIG